jgi:hypothetical protein
MDKFLSGCKRKDRDNKAGSSKDNEVSSGREMVCKKPQCRKYDIKHLPFGFTNTDIDGIGKGKGKVVPVLN